MNRVDTKDHRILDSRLNLSLIGALALLAVTACNMGPVVSGETVRPEIQMKGLSDTLSVLSIEVTGQGIHSRFSFSPTNSKFVMALPARETVTFDVMAVPISTNPSYRGRVGLDLSGGGATSGTVNMQPGWSLSTRYTSPAIGPDGILYVIDSDGYLNALSSYGARYWRRDIANGAGATMRPAVAADGTVYVGSTGNDELYAYSSEGRRLWSFSLDSDPIDGLALGPDGSVHALSYNGTLYAVNPDGTQKWSLSLGDLGRSAPAVDADGRIFVAAEPVGDNTSMLAVSAAGSLLWENTGLGTVAGSSPAIGADGTVYIGDQATSSVHAFDPGTSGDELWAYDVTTQAVTGLNALPNTPPAIASDGTLYVSVEDGSFDFPSGLLALNPDGTAKWFFETTGLSSMGVPAIGSDGTIYFQDGGALTLYAVNPDGTQKWSIDLNAIGSGAPAIDGEGRLYHGDGSYFYTIQTGNSGLGGGSWPRGGGRNNGGAAYGGS